MYNCCIATYLKEIYMFTSEFEKQYKDAVAKFEVVAEHIKQANEFWFNAILSSFKSFSKTK